MDSRGRCFARSGYLTQPEEVLRHEPGEPGVDRPGLGEVSLEADEKGIRKDHDPDTAVEGRALGPGNLRSRTFPLNSPRGSFLKPRKVRKAI